jgi:hypothetical protein
MRAPDVSGNAADVSAPLRTDVSALLRSGVSECPFVAIDSRSLGPDTVNNVTDLSLETT